MRHPRTGQAGGGTRVSWPRGSVSERSSGGCGRAPSNNGELPEQACNVQGLTGFVKSTLSAGRLGLSFADGEAGVAWSEMTTYGIAGADEGGCVVRLRDYYRDLDAPRADDVLAAAFATAATSPARSSSDR
jgi:hypothetical protein